MERDVSKVVMLKHIKRLCGLMGIIFLILFCFLVYGFSSQDKKASYPLTSQVVLSSQEVIIQSWMSKDGLVLHIQDQSTPQSKHRFLWVSANTGQVINELKVGYVK